MTGTGTSLRLELRSNSRFESNPLKIGRGAFEIFPSRIPRVCCGVLAKTFQVET